MALEVAYSFNSDYTDVANGRTITSTGNSAIVAGGQTGNALGKTGATMPVLPAAALAALQSDDRTMMLDAKGDLFTWWIRFNDSVFGSGMWGILNLNDGGGMKVQARDNSGSHNLATRPAASSPGAAWHNYCATYVRSTGVITLYKDGVSASTSSFAAGTQLATTADTIDLAEWSTTGAAVDNLRLYSHALNSTEVAAVAGTPVTATAPAWPVPPLSQLGTFR